MMTLTLEYVKVIFIVLDFMSFYDRWNILEKKKVLIVILKVGVIVVITYYYNNVHYCNISY